MSHTSKRRSWYANIINHAIRLVIFLILTILAVWVYDVLFEEIRAGRSHFWAFLLLWLFSAYIVVPRLNRRLARIYLPSYFIGRANTGDGLLGDPINLALYGSREQLVAAMTKAGWRQADILSLKSSWKMIWTAGLGRPYPNAPVSSLFLFGRRQDLAFQRQVGNNPRKRHHVRFWQTPKKWWLPGGYQADWLGSATYDKHVGLSLFTGQITHKIDADVDAERDFLIQTLREAGATEDVQIVEHFTTSYNARNGGGDVIHTDGSLPFITLS